MVEPNRQTASNGIDLFFSRIPVLQRISSDDRFANASQPTIPKTEPIEKWAELILTSLAPSYA